MKRYSSKQGDKSIATEEKKRELEGFKLRFNAKVAVQKARINPWWRVRDASIFCEPLAVLLGQILQLHRQISHCSL